jgi:translocation and assembly module TamB
VLRAQYIEPMDLERRMLEFGKRVPEPKPYDKAGEWLRLDVKLVVDGDARIENDLVRGSVKGELTVTGDLANLGMLGSLSIAPGSRASFRSNEFNLSRGLVAFTDRYRIRSSLDVYGESTVRDYQVFIHVLGSLEEPQVQLTSSPALSQEDIITLLSLGYTTRDTTISAPIGAAATAAAAQALFAVSGLNEQLRRFLPKGGFFQDFSFRVTSAYSQATFQVEPKMEFETKAVDSRLRLRYLAPLGAGRGQKAQVEWRFPGERVSIQGQWDNDNPDVSTGSDLGVDLKLRWEWSD